MSNGKGDKPRPMTISREEYEQRWNAIFGPKEIPADHITPMASPPSPRDIERLARTNAIVAACHANLRNGIGSYEQFLMQAVVLLAEQNERLLRELTDLAMRYPGPLL